MVGVHEEELDPEAPPGVSRVFFKMPFGLPFIPREVEVVEVADDENETAVGPTVDRRLEEALPLPKVDRLPILLNQCRKILSARNLHIPAGYAAVGAV